MGLMHITGHRDGPPAKVGVAVTDLTTGLYTSNSILAGLLTRARTGKGQRIDVALSDCRGASQWRPRHTRLFDKVTVSLI